MKAYRLKHISTGLYYQPSSGGSNLSKHGKVYLTKQNPLIQNRGMDYIWIDINKYSRIYKEYAPYFHEFENYTTRDISCRIPKSEFEIEYIAENEK